jgi:Bacterial protein of unknown function (DUF922)
MFPLSPKIPTDNTHCLFDCQSFAGLLKLQRFQSIMKNIFLFITLLFFSSVFISAQNLPGKEIRDRNVEWADFSGKIDNASVWDSVTNWTTVYSFSAPSFQGNSAFVNITVRLFLKSDSWVKPNKKSQKLLEHEQGHFKIGRICADEIESTVNSTAFDRTGYHQQIDKLYWEIIAKYQTMNAKYEKDTNHSKNRQQQTAWNKKLDNLLSSGKVEN